MTRPRPVHLVVVAFCVVAAACGGADTTTTTAPSSTTSTSTTSTTSSTTVPDTDGSVAYFFVEAVDPAGDASLVPVWRDGDSTVAQSLLGLFAGPGPDELAGTPAISTAIPQGVQLLGVDVVDTTATVDVSAAFEEGGGSAAMFGRLAQLVFTATRSDDIDRVVLTIEGEAVEVFSSEGIVLDQPLTRDDFAEDHLPAIFVDVPAWGQPVTSPVTVTGVANVFEAVFHVMLTDDDGLPLAEDVVMATCGTGCWGTFDVELAFDVDRDQVGALIVWAESPMDGSRIEVREYPVRLTSSG